MMDWLTFFLINLMGLGFVGLFAVRAVPEENQTRVEEVMQNMPGLLVSVVLGFVNVIFVVDNFEALAVFERVPWIVGSVGWAVLAVMAFLPGESSSGTKE